MKVNTLLDAYKLSKKLDLNLDLADDTFDWCNCYEINEIPKDNYDKCMLKFGEMRCVDMNSGYIICDICEYIDQHRKAFDKFMNEENKDCFKPMNYDRVEVDEEEFFDLYLTTFESLLNGNYCEEDYEKLNKYLDEE